jgi:hypothetical protein
MNTGSHSDNVVPEAAPAATHQVFSVEEVGKPDRRWRVVIRPGDLALYEGDDPQPFVILREQMQREVFLIEGMRVLTLGKPKKVSFKLSPAACEAISEWIGRPVLAAHYMKRRYSWVLPVAIIWILGSLPLPGDPESGVEAVPPDSIGIVLGVALLISWAFAKWRPHPVLFLVDSIWFLCLAGYLTYDVWHGRSKLWMILVGLLLWMVITGFKHFTRFKGTVMNPAA